MTIGFHKMPFESGGSDYTILGGRGSCQAEGVRNLLPLPTGLGRSLALPTLRKPQVLILP